MNEKNSVKPLQQSLCLILTLKIEHSLCLLKILVRTCLLLNILKALIYHFELLQVPYEIHFS